MRILTLVREQSCSRTGWYFRAFPAVRMAHIRLLLAGFQAFLRSLFQSLCNETDIPITSKTTTFSRTVLRAVPASTFSQHWDEHEGGLDGPHENW